MKKMLIDKLKGDPLLEKGLLTYSYSINGDFYVFDAISSEILKTGEIIADISEALSNKTKKTRFDCMLDLLNKYNYNDILKGIDTIKFKQEKESVLELIPDNITISLKRNKALYNKKINGIALVLEVTQDCNLRCKYCPASEIYYDSNRKHLKKNMTDDIAFKSIKLFLEHSTCDDPSIIFFGGEPLLKKEMIINCINFALKINPKVKFFIQTNGYLLDDIFFRKVKDKNVKIGISLDGPVKIHDYNRVLKDGKGTFNTIMENIIRLAHNDLDSVINKLFFIVTLSDVKNIYGIIEFFTKHPILKQIKLELGFIEYHGIKYEFKERFTLKWPKNIINPIFKTYLNLFEKNVWKFLNVHHAIFFPLLHCVLDREPIKGNMLLKKVCVPGNFRFFVDVDGNLRICEKKYSMPKIGNIFNGINWNIVKKMESEFISTCNPCLRCWALTMCNVCYQHVYNYRGKFDPEIKESFCKGKKEQMSMALKLFTCLVEKNPDAFDIIPEENWKLII